MADDVTVYVNITSKKTPRDAPPGHENWFVMVNVPHDQGQDWAALTQQTRAAENAEEAIVAALERAVVRQ